MLDLSLLCKELKDAGSPLRKCACGGIRELYALLHASSPRTADVLAGWKEEFRYIYGDAEANLASNRKLDVSVLLAEYEIELTAEERPAQAAQLLLFAIQTWFSLLVKWMMRDMLDGLSGAAGQDSAEDIILGRFACRRGIENYCDADWYCWPVFELGRGADRVWKDIAGQVARYRTAATVDEFVRDNNYDYIKQMYETVIPRHLRHALGEYYTPDWLAELTLKEAMELQGDKSAERVRVIDPTCGSGTFLFQTIRSKRKQGCGLNAVLDTVTGFDINPLAVLTAKTNYLLAVMDLLPQGGQVMLPVYNVDMIRFPEETAPENSGEDFLHTIGPAQLIRDRIACDRKRAAQVKPADIVAGNPPWVNWEYLPEDYRMESRHLWADYGLFSAKGRDLSFSKEDISVLITYLAADKLLKQDGVLAFVIRRAVFKSEQNGVGFRRFQIRNQCGLKVLKVADLSKIKAFENAVTSAAVFFARKGGDTTYPIPYQLWERRENIKRGGFHAYSDLDTVLGQMNIRQQQAMPSVAEDPTSLWITADPAVLSALSNVLGTNRYKARTGVFTGGANGVYWLRVLGMEDGKLRVANVAERAKRKARSVTALVEPDYVFPMVRGSDVNQWQVRSNTWLLCPHTTRTKQWPVPGAELEAQAPATYAYLNGFRAELDGRKGFAGWERDIQKQEFHAILRVGEYTFSPYKVVWRYIATRFICAVMGAGEDPWLGEKQYLPNEKVMYVSLENEDEAYYLCGLLSSSPVACCVQSYMNPTSISAHVLDKLNLPTYDPNDPRHRRITELCKAGHREGDIPQRLREIDTIAADLYGIDRAWLEAMR